MPDILRNINGFSRPVETEEEGILEGFNLREAEVYFSANVDPYFSGYLIAAVLEETAHIEEAVIQTTSLPYGLEIKGGKLLSNFGRINSQHGHFWDFTDQPLVYALTLGDHGINDTGLQLSWLAPTEFYLSGGIEAFTGNNEGMFSYAGENPLPDKPNPRLLVGWLKTAPNLTAKHALQFGASLGKGLHQETSDADSNGLADRWLDGSSRFWGLDFVYKYNAMRSYGQGNLVIQGEYFSRAENLTVAGDTLTPASVEQEQLDKQDGYYIQATYGFLPRWQAGLRWEQVGLLNKTDWPDGTSDNFGDSNRLALALTHRLTEFSYLRLQFSNGNYDTPSGVENASEVFLQMQISIGKHGAHKF
jgi:hypothetical protein